MRHPGICETRRFLGIRILFILFASGPGILRGQTVTPQTLPDGQGKALVAVACTQCHGLTPIVQIRDGVGGWKNTVEEMVLRGTQLSPTEADTVVRYLLENFGPAAEAFQTGRLPHDSAVSRNAIESSDVTLPEGPGRELVQMRCVMCHDIGRVVTVRRSREEWERITKNMIERGPQATPEQMQAIVSYLGDQFGK